MAIALLVLSVSTARASAGPAMRAVAYAGYRFEVPASWPVFDLSRQPQTCVRFDLHAVYLGTPGADQNCPSWLFGTTETILIQPGPLDAQRQTLQIPVSNQITATAPGISVTATFDTQPAVIVSILASAGLASPTLAAARSAGGGGSARELVASAARAHDAAWTADVAATQELPASADDYVGLGFDACAAPSSAVMQAWLQSSPYRAIGIYIGGADRSCYQQNLTSAWVAQQAAAGWHFIPMYAGPQASLGQLTAPVPQGIADANDAVAQAQQLGFGPGTPLYYDMEAYLPPESGPAMQFLSAWTTQLHNLGYAAGVYVASDSGTTDLARQYQAGGVATPDVIFDALWNGQANTNDPNIPSGEWTGGRRLHQFSGNVAQSFGGDPMLIDQDYLDVTLGAATPSASPSPSSSSSASPSASAAPSPSPSPSPTPSPSPATSASPSPSGSPSQSSSPPLTSSPSASSSPPAPSLPSPSAPPSLQIATGGTVQASSAVITAAGSPAVFFVGKAHHLVEESESASGDWTLTNLGGVVSSTPSVVEVGSGTLDVFYRGPDNRLWERTNNGTGWLAAQRLGQMGPVGTPEAIAQPGGVIDVFWQGFHGVRLWHAQYVPGLGWTGPQNLGGTLGGTPSPVLQPSGEVQVFWKSKVYGELWRVYRDPDSNTWGSPQDLGMGQLGGSPQAVALPNGDVDVFWRGSAGQHLVYSVELSPAGTPAAPANPGGARGTGQPRPIMASGGEWLLLRGQDGGLRAATRTTDGQWPASLPVAKIAGLESAPYAAVGPPDGPLVVFWIDASDRLWAAQFTQTAGWTEPVDLT